MLLQNSIFLKSYFSFPSRRNHDIYAHQLVFRVNELSSLSCLVMIRVRKEDQSRLPFGGPCGWSKGKLWIGINCNQQGVILLCNSTTRIPLCI